MFSSIFLRQQRYTDRLSPTSASKIATADIPIEDELLLQISKLRSTNINTFSLTVSLNVLKPLPHSARKNDGKKNKRKYKVFH